MIECHRTRTRRKLKICNPTKKIKKRKEFILSNVK
jgi:hypothetical protein